MNIIIFLFIIIIVIGIQFFRSHIDEDNIKSHIEKQGGKFISKDYNFFMSSRNNTIYNVVYKDKDGKKHKASAKYSLIMGVSLWDDQIIP